MVQDALKIVVDMQIGNSVTRYHDVAETGCLSLLMAELFRNLRLLFLYLCSVRSEDTAVFHRLSFVIFQ